MSAAAWSPSGGARSGRHDAPPGSNIGLSCHNLKLGARYYNPTTARFTQPDPAGQGTNPYTYAGDNPTNNTDPSGQGFFNTLSVALGAVGLVTAVLGLTLLSGGTFGAVLLATGIVASEASTAFGVACLFPSTSNC